MGTCKNFRLQNLSFCLPTLPVRPIRCTYSSMLLGKSKLMTCFTFLMSNPRAATPVATRMFLVPRLKSARASSRSRCNLSPWILVVWMLFSLRYVARKSAFLLVSTKTTVRSVPAGMKIYDWKINTNRKYDDY